MKLLGVTLRLTLVATALVGTSVARRVIIAAASASAAGAAPFFGSCLGCFIADLAGIELTTPRPPGAEGCLPSSPTDAGLLTALIGASAGFAVFAIAGTAANAVLLANDEGDTVTAPLSEPVDPADAALELPRARIASLAQRF